MRKIQETHKAHESDKNSKSQVKIAVHLTNLLSYKSAINAQSPLSGSFSLRFCVKYSLTSLILLAFLLCSLKKFLKQFVFFSRSFFSKMALDPSPLFHHLAVASRSASPLMNERGTEL